MAANAGKARQVNAMRVDRNDEKPGCHFSLPIGAPYRLFAIMVFIRNSIIHSESNRLAAAFFQKALECFQTEKFSFNIIVVVFPEFFHSALVAPGRNSGLPDGDQFPFGSSVLWHNCKKLGLEMINWMR